MRELGVGKSLVFGRWNTVLGQEILGKTLGPFELSGGASRAENLQTFSAESIDHTLRQRRFRADHGQRDIFALHKFDEFRDRRDVDVGQPRLKRRAGVARRDKYLGGLGRLQDLPRKRMFATAGTDDKNIHVDPE